MKAVYYEAPKTWSVTEIPTPDAAPGQVRIKVGQVGVCGTDLHIDEGEFGAVFPLVPGHELVGRSPSTRTCTADSAPTVWQVG
jgi:D-arabinitol dehydrogenase (NADP+)